MEDTSPRPPSKPPALIQELVDEFARRAKAEHGLSRFDLGLRRDGRIELELLVVGREFRKNGRGSAAMRALLRLADAYGVDLVLTPSSRDRELGTTSHARLVGFYRRFGFEENRGRRRDFSLSDGMIRKGRAPSSAAAPPLGPPVPDEPGTDISSVLRP